MVERLQGISFHDAEVVAVRLDRTGVVMDLEIDMAAPVRAARALRLRFDGVSNLRLADFNEQNSLFDLTLVWSEDAALWDVVLQPNYGLAGSFRCRALTLT